MSATPATPQRITGVLSPVVTPFKRDLSPDPVRYVRHCKWLLSQGCAGLAVFGTNSEANSLGLEERLALLDALLALELSRGRTRTFANAPRILDLDVLLYGDQQIAEPGLSVPHPRMHERAFVLVPLAEIAPDCVIPGRGTVRELLRQVDQRGVRIAEGARTVVNAS